MSKKKLKFNNTIVEYKGKKVKSKFERDMMIMLDMLNIPYKDQVKYELVPSYTAWDGSTVRSVNMYVDFVFEIDGMTYIVDTKGAADQLSIDKYKALGYIMSKRGIPHEIHWPRTKGQCQEIAIRLHAKLAVTKKDG